VQGSRSNVELVYAALAAHQRGDQDELRRLMDLDMFGWLYEIRDGRATRVYVTVDGAVEVARDLAKAPR
jgi:hypothetical protein